MQLSLRPYVTAGVALAGASVIAVAPIQPTPTDIQIPNPTVQVVRDVQLTADEIETAWNNAVLQVTELGLGLTVPLTAALIEAIAPDLIVEPLTSDAVATFLLLGLSGYAISGGGSIGTALQDVVDGFGVDFGTGLVALLVGAPSTIIQGYVLGGFGPDLTGVLTDAGFPVPPAIPIAPGVFRPVENVFAGGLINNPALTMLPGGLQLVPLFGLIPGVPTGFNIILPGLFPTLGTGLQGLLDAVDIGGLSSGGGLLGGLLDNLPGLGGLLDDLGGGLPGLTSLTSGDTNSVTSTETLKTDTELVTLTVPDQADPKLDTAIDPGARAEEALGSVKVPPQGQAQAGIQKALEKVGAAGPKLNVQKVNPLDRSSATDDTAKPSGSHRPDKGTVSVSEVTAKVNAGVGKGRDKDSDDGTDSEDSE